jgi:hypothetical protein
MADIAMIQAFLQTVATDAAYRDQLISEPMRTLTEAGFAVSAEDIPPGGIMLPSNADILANLDGLSAEIHGVHWYKLAPP